LSQPTRSLIAAALAAATLAGCSGVSDDFMRALGKEKVVPDEFAVVSRAPLAIPPDYALRPPRIGAARPQEQTTTEQARQTVFRAGDQTAALPPAAASRSAGEGQLLKEAGAANAPPNIRDLVNNEAADSGQLSDSFVDKLSFWRTSDKPGATNEVIDPNLEAQRLKDEKDAATAAAAPPPAPVVPPSLDGTPTIERTPEKTLFGDSWLGRIF
jgi:hypothetical protein